MEILATLRDSDVGKEAKKPFKLREERLAGRAIVLGQDGHLGLLYSDRGRYYKLPGGGLKPKEAKNGDFESAAARETFEEMGARIAIIAEIGMIIEERADDGLRQLSAYYLARQIGKLKKPALTRLERREGIKRVWAHDIVTGLDLVTNPHPRTSAGKFMPVRDGIGIQAAIDLVGLDDFTGLSDTFDLPLRDDHASRLLTKV